MDEVAEYNQKRWERLVQAQALFTRPYLDLTEAEARQRLDPHGMLETWHISIADSQVLCLASGGGQQSAAFSLLGAHVTVVDLSPGQLARDRQVAEHYGVPIRTVEADMRDLSPLQSDSFDIVWHPYSINFVPDVGVVFDEVARVMRPGGLYHVMCANPFSCGMGTRDWNGAGYTLHRPYVDGAVIEYPDEDWVIQSPDASDSSIEGPREYRHTLSTMVNQLAARGFVLLGLQEAESNDIDAEPATWDHFVGVAPPWFFLWAQYVPSLLHKD